MPTDHLQEMTIDPDDKLHLPEKQPTQIIARYSVNTITITV